MDGVPKAIDRLPLGCTARDVVTGFAGTLTGYAMYLTGCDQVCLLHGSDSGSKAESYWVDVTRAERIGEGTVALVEDVAANPGGPQDHPTRA